MSPSEFDKQNIRKICEENYGDWFGAELLRFLNRNYRHMDAVNRAIFDISYPEYVQVVTDFQNGKLN